MARTLLIGANSTIAQALRENSEREFLTFSRSEGTLNLDNAYAAREPKNTEKNVAPNPIIKELEYLGKNLEGPVITISLLLTNSSYQVSGGGRESK